MSRGIFRVALKRVYHCRNFLAIAEMEVWKASGLVISFWMVFMWLIGDVMKVVFFVKEGQPMQFVLSACFLCTFDVLILGQFVLYRQKKEVVKDYERPN